MKDKYLNGRVANKDREMIKQKRKSVQTALNLYIELERFGFMDKAVDLFRRKYPESYEKVMKERRAKCSR